LIRVLFTDGPCLQIVGEHDLTHGEILDPGKILATDGPCDAQGGLMPFQKIAQQADQRPPAAAYVGKMSGPKEVAGEHAGISPQQAYPIDKNIDESQLLLIVTIEQATKSTVRGLQAAVSVEVAQLYGMAEQLFEDRDGVLTVRIRVVVRLIGGIVCGSAIGCAHHPIAISATNPFATAITKKICMHDPGLENRTFDSRLVSPISAGGSYTVLLYFGQSSPRAFVQ
jgi:hypothetical protein